MTPENNIRAVKRRHSRHLLSQPGVCGLDIETGADGRPMFTIHLDSDDPAVRERLPKQIEGYPVKLVESGPFQKY